MGYESVYKAQILPLSRDPFQSVTTFLLCHNGLLRAGISHLLAGTHFHIADDASVDATDFPTCGKATSTLILICESLSLDGYLALIERLKAQHPSAQLVVLADDLEPQGAAKLCKAGLNGLCSTSMPQEAMVKALELVMLGECYLPASIGLQLLEQASCDRAFFGRSAPANDEYGQPRQLSDREAQILRHLMQGASNKAIARKLGLAEATVKVHLKGILRKIKAANRTQAAIWAREHMAGADPFEPEALQA
jgi:two-component system nitrate/nitrite response regulator NarL